MDSVGLDILVACSLIACPVLCNNPWEKGFLTQRTLNAIPLEVIRSNPGKNVAVAPFLFRYPLCKLAHVATGETKKELMAVLDMKESSDTSSCFSDVFSDITKMMETDLTLFNKIYINNTDAVKQQFLKDSQRYGVTVAKVGFYDPRVAVAVINREFYSKTYKRLRDVLEVMDIDKNSSIVLVNGVHMRLTWDSGRNFDVKNTKTQFFYQHANKKVQVQMMSTRMTGQYLDSSDDALTAVSIKLIHYGLSVMFMVPYPTVSIDHLIMTLTQTPDTLEKIRKSMKFSEFRVQLPRFKIETGLDWTDYLRLIGLSRTLNNTNTDLNSILNTNTNYNMYLSKAKQKVFLDIDERQNVDENNSPEELPLDDITNTGVPEFVADKPFFYFVSMVGEKGVPVDLVSGVYYGPEE